MAKDPGMSYDLLLIRFRFVLIRSKANQIRPFVLLILMLLNPSWLPRPCCSIVNLFDHGDGWGSVRCLEFLGFFKAREVKEEGYINLGVFLHEVKRA